MKPRNRIVNTLFFAFIFSFRVLPPLFVKYSQTHSGYIPVFSSDWLSLTYTLVWLLFMTFVAVPFLHDEKPSAMIGTDVFVVAKWLWCIPALLSLAGFNQMWQQVARLCGSPSPVITPSGSAFLTPFVVVFVALSAFSEEVLYRRYLPDAFSTCVPSFWANALSVIIFGLSHRYLGWTAAANACCAAVVFTLLQRKNGSVVYAGTVHFLYNLILCLCV